jgi:hypothetical protein
MYATAHGLDGDDSNDGIDIITTGLRSASGGLQGDLLGLRPPPPFDGSGWDAGQQHDLDGDGDLDIGPAIGSPPNLSTGYYALREVPTSSYVQPPGGYFVGQMRFSVSSLSADSTTINFFKRPTSEAVLLAIDNQGLKYVPPSGITLGPDVIIQRGISQGGGIDRYIDGTYDTHLTINNNTAVTPGKWLLLGQGLDVPSGGLLDTSTGTAALFQINDAQSGNMGGTILGDQMSIATSADGTFTQAQGYTRLGPIDVGASAGRTGVLSITGGSIDAGAVTVGAAGAGRFEQAGGTATFASLQLSSGSSADVTGGNLLVVGDAQIGAGGGAALNVVGGQTEITGDLVLDSTSPGSVNLSGGSLAAYRTMIGFDPAAQQIAGSGSINQSGGTFAPGTFVMANASSTGQSTYALSQGKVHADSIFLDDGASFAQTAGDVSVSGVMQVARTAAGPSHVSQYVISGGTLDVGIGIVVNKTNAPSVGRIGGFVQTGGTVTTQQLNINASGTYQALGGTLNVNRQLLLKGSLDFAGSPTTANFGTNTFADFSQGELLGTENATFTGGPGSLLNFAPGFDPYARIGHITTQGLIHINGQPLTIPSDRSVGGSGTIQGNVTNQGLLAPGNSPGEIDIAGDYVQASDAQLSMEIAGTSSDEFDLLSVTGDVHLGGSLSVALLDGFVPSPEDRFTIINAGDLSGIFSNAVDSIDFPSGRFDVLYSPTSVTLTDFQQVPEPVGIGLLAMVGSVAIARRRRRRT